LRSNDMFSAWVANAMGLRALQGHIKEQIEARSPQKLDLGPLITISQSAHIYSDCWEHSDRVIASEYFQILQQRQFDDPVGSFTIRVETGQICVEHLTPGSGEVIGCYVGKAAKSIYQQLAAACPILQPEHALYLGTELQKAEIALKNSALIYQQDRPLS
jgi:thymidylate synthase